MKKSALIFGIISTAAFVVTVLVLIALAVVSTFASSLSSSIDVPGTEQTLQSVLYPAVGVTVASFAISYVIDLIAGRRGR